MSRKKGTGEEKNEQHQGEKRVFSKIIEGNDRRDKKEKGKKLTKFFSREEPGNGQRASGAIKVKASIIIDKCHEPNHKQRPEEKRVS